MEVTKNIEKKARNLAVELLEELTNCFSKADEDYVTNTIITFLEEL